MVCSGLQVGVDSRGQAVRETVQASLILGPEQEGDPRDQVAALLDVTVQLQPFEQAMFRLASVAAALDAQRTASSR